MISLYIRKKGDRHLYIVLDDNCMKVAEGSIKDVHDWREILRIIAERSGVYERLP